MRLPFLMTIFAIAMFSAVSGRVEASACRSHAVVYQFKKSHPCPAYLIINGKCTGIVDHECALANSGVDSLVNLQWQSPEASKAKDRIENTPEGKLIWCNPMNSTKTRQVFNCK